MANVLDKEILLFELLRFYKHIDVQTDNPMTNDAQIMNYHNHLIEQDAIRVIMNGDRLLAYIAYYRINHEQLGRIICQEPFNACSEDIKSGNICYLIDVTIDPDYRLTEVGNMLKKLFFEKNQDCDYFIGHAIYKKRSQPIRVFKRTEFMKRYLRGE